MFKKFFKKTCLVLFWVFLFVLNQLPMGFAALNLKYHFIPGWGVVGITLSVLFVFLLYINYHDLLNFRHLFKLRSVKIILLAYFCFLGISVVGQLFLFFEKASDTANQKVLMEMMRQMPAVLMFLLAVISAPIEEELLFRYLIPKKIFQGHQKIGFTVGTLLFALIHMPTNVGSFVIYAGMGSILSYVYYKYNRFEYVVFLHFLNNFIGFLVLLHYN